MIVRKRIPRHDRRTELRIRNVRNPTSVRGHCGNERRPSHGRAKRAACLYGCECRFGRATVIRLIRSHSACRRCYRRSLVTSSTDPSPGRVRTASSTQKQKDRHHAPPSRASRCGNRGGCNVASSCHGRGQRPILEEVPKWLTPSPAIRPQRRGSQRCDPGRAGARVLLQLAHLSHRTA